MCRHKELDETQFVRFRLLVEDEEVDVNCTDDVFGRTPLIWLCQNNQSDGLFGCVELLLQRSDVKINQTDQDQKTALMTLCNWSKSGQIVEVAQLLIAKGIDIHHRDNKRMNALMHLRRSSKSNKLGEVTQLLIANGIDINQTNAIVPCQEKWEKVDEELKFNKNNELGRGGFGTVYKGKYVLVGTDKEIDVAVKRIDVERVKLEDEILAKVGNHRNVLHFYCAKDIERFRLR